MGSTLQNFHVDEFLLSRAQNGVSDGTLRKYKFAMQTFTRWIADRPVTDTELMEYMSYLYRQPLSDEYRKTNAMTLRACLTYLREAGYDFPAPTYKPVKIHKRKKTYLTPEQIQKLLNARASRRAQLAIRLFLTTGIRLTELCYLTWACVNFKSGVIDVLNGKGKKYRQVVTDKKTLALLIRARNHQSPDDDSAPVIPTADGSSRMTPEGMRSLMHRVSERTQIPFTPHCLRRTFARQAKIAGMDIAWIQQLMGHSSIEMTKRYIGDLDVEDVASAYNKCPPIPY